jgi:serine O-acetyltransferase (EC 2.3.1.30)
MIPELYRVLNTDIDAIVTGDPAAHNRFEVIRAYPGFLLSAFTALRMHYSTWKPRCCRASLLNTHIRRRASIFIPPQKSGEHFFIDHGTGIVIGETTIIGNHVKLYQGVTLGALSVDKDMAFIKRHPTVEDHVIIYSGATILGGETVIGHHSTIGGNVWLTKSVPPYSTVYHRALVDVVKQNNV